jgi:hypothetical protein
MGDRSWEKPVFQYSCFPGNWQICLAKHKVLNTIRNKEIFSPDQVGNDLSDNPAKGTSRIETETVCYRLEPPNKIVPEIVSDFSVVRSRNPISSSVISIYLRSELTLIDTKSYRPGVL